MMFILKFKFIGYVLLQMSSVANSMNTRKHCLITCFYMIPCITWVLVSREFYVLGKLYCYPFLIGITLCEITKRVVSRAETKPNFRDSKKKSKIGDFSKCCLLVFLITGTHYAVAVLFGAQLFDECEETFVFSCLLSALTVIPSCIHLGFQETVNIFSDLFVARNEVSSDIILQHIRLVYFGAWIGAIVIPLDWDRPWQKWPIPCSLCALMCYVSSHIYSLRHSFTLTKKSRKYDL